MMFLIAKLAVILCCFLPLSGSLECYQCSNITNTNQCQTRVSCLKGQKCFTSAHGVGLSETFDLGCKSEAECISNAGISIVGRSTSSQRDCAQCCQIDYCNKKLCSSGVPVVNEVGPCRDDPSFNCSEISSVFNICSDVHHAKLKCRKFCGLCNLIDGNWAVWSSWKSCDVTCGSGHMTRKRMCAKPAPAHGGLDCVGNSTEMTTCNLRTCPVHGGWSLWSSWGNCSVTCGIGLERRDRNCSNPYPSPDGSPCAGDSRDDRPCFIKPCSDGVWSTWNDWGTCSATCLGGLQKRKRTCNNPAPTRFGHDCVGNNEDYQLCNNKECFHTTVMPVSFRATNVTYPSGLGFRIVIHTNNEMNIGGGYDNTTGIFTAPESGVYFFVVHMCVVQQHSIFVHIVQDSHVETSFFVDGSNNSICDSTSALLPMNIGSKVWVTLSGNASQDSHHVSFFQGIKMGV